MTTALSQPGAILSGHSAGVDWVTLTGKRGMADVSRTVRAIAVEAPMPRTDAYYETSEYFPGSGIHLKRHNVSNRDAWLVSIPGSACSLLGDRLRRVVADLVEMGEAQFSRIDCAVDFTADNGSRLLETLGRLAVQRRLGRGGTNTQSDNGHTVYIGRRTSETFVRCYDKGAETGGEAGKWIRWEAEFKKKRANELTKYFLRSDDWTKLSFDLAAAAVPSLEKVAPEIHHEMFRTTGVRPAIQRENSELEAWIEHTRKQLMRVVWLAEKTNRTPQEIAEIFQLYDVVPSRNVERHSSWFSAAVLRIDDMISHNGEEEEENTESGRGVQATARDQDESHVDDAHGGEH